MRRYSKHEGNPQYVKIKDSVITVTSKNGSRNIVCKFTITLEEWYDAETNFGNPNYWVRDLVRAKFFEAYPTQIYPHHLCLLERLVDYQVEEIKKALKKWKHYTTH